MFAKSENSILDKIKNAQKKIKKWKCDTYPYRNCKAFLPNMVIFKYNHYSFTANTKIGLLNCRASEKPAVFYNFIDSYL